MLFPTINSLATCKVQTATSHLRKNAKNKKYDKIDDVTRYKLIETLKKGENTLKGIADELSINYSTAKTILQTFRKEKRIRKKSKHQLATKKSAKHELYLKQVLDPIRVLKMIDSVLSTELVINEKKSANRDNLQNLPSFNSLTRPSVVTTQFQENKKLCKLCRFARIESADQIQLLENAVEGPKAGQVSRAVAADVSFTLKKDIFYVQSQPSAEEDSKHIVNEPEDKQRKLSESDQLLSFKSQSFVNENPVNTFNNADNEVEEARLTFDFNVYKTLITERIRVQDLGSEAKACK